MIPLFTNDWSETMRFRFSIRTLLLPPISFAIFFAVHAGIPYHSMFLHALGYCVAGAIPFASLGYDISGKNAGSFWGALIGATLAGAVFFCWAAIPVPRG